jgi:hypothetical protein
MRTPLKAVLACLLAACAGCMATKTTPSAPVTVTTPVVGTPTDWRWVQGMVFVPTNAVNEAQEWDQYDPAVNDRELHYASTYGVNVVRVYLHYYVYLKKKTEFLGDIEDFLTRADKYGIRTEFVFFDDCWNQPPKELLSADYRYPAPLQGVHNSQWLVCPGEDVRSHYEQHRKGLKSYVQDIVNAHVADKRVVFWEIYNEPNKSMETVRLEKDAAIWIKETGTKIPATATGDVFSGTPFSDFVSWHRYQSYEIFGDQYTLCTECMNRQGQTVPGIVSHFKGKVGYIMWEFGIGRDNCRFAWGENREKPRKDEAVTPFHGVVYPDGHPWSVDDAKALLGDGYAKTPFFAVSYYRGDSFTDLAKKSVTPMIDFDLGTEVGTGSPDASVRVPKENYSISYAGDVAAPTDGSYTITADTDGLLEVAVDGAPIISKAVSGRAVVSATVHLEGDRNHSIAVRYQHGSGPTNLHLSWSGPGFESRLLLPSTHPLGI